MIYTFLGGFKSICNYNYFTFFNKISTNEVLSLGYKCLYYLKYIPAKSESVLIMLIILLEVIFTPT